MGMNGIWAVTVMIAVSQAGLAQQGGGLSGRRLDAVVSGLALGNINLNDARAGIKVWFDGVVRRRGQFVDSNVEILNSLEEIRERLKKRPPNICVLGIRDYLGLEDSRLIAPALTHVLTAGGEAPYSYLLLVNPSSGITSLGGLRGKKILVSSRGGGDTGLVWLSVLLDKEKLGAATAFFDSLRVPAKAQGCILPLFFGTIDACVVDEVSLSLAAEMNPQINRLRALARSRPMIGSVIATPVKPSSFENEVIATILSLHEDVSGRQLLTVFRADHLVRIRPGDLDAARELWQDYNRLPVTSRSYGPMTTGLTAGKATERE